MKIRLGLLLLYGIIQTDNKVIDLPRFEIRDDISSEYVKQKCLECCEKIVKNPYFNNEAFRKAAQDT